MKKQNVFILVIIFSLSVFTFFSFKYRDEKPEKLNIDKINPNQISIISSLKMDVNNISTWYRNNGSFNRNPSTGNSGFEYPKGTSKFARFASGLWLGAQVGIDTLVAIVEYDYEYLPGYIDNSGLPQGSTDPLYKVYSIIRGDTTSPDYQNWPANQGAYLNAQGKPFFLGTQTMFYSYTDGYPEAHSNDAGSTAPLKAVVLQTNWSYTNVNLKDVIFTEYKIINRNSLPWNNAYISIWTDDDLGDGTDDAVGVDTNLRLGYTYNYSASDPQYGSAPPAVGFMILRNPIVPSPGDTVKYYNPPGSNNLVAKPNFKELKLSSHNTYSNGDPKIGDPRNYTETYFNLQGLQRLGTSWINPFSGQDTKFAYSGDPVTGSGWNMEIGNDRRGLLTFGPITMNPGDTQSVIVAQVIAQGSSNLNSITKLRDLSILVRGVYNSNFQNVLAVNNISSEIPNGFSLSQNFPNPFNPVTKINYELQITNYVSLKVFDILGNEVATIVNEKQNAGTYEVEFDGSNLPSGIYFYSLYLNQNLVETKKSLLTK